MKSTALYLALTLLAASPVLICQTTTGGPSEMPGAFSSSSQTGDATPPPATALKKYDTTPAPFSRFALGGGMSLMGVNLEAAVNVNEHLNIRGTGNFFAYTVNNISTNGFNLAGKVNFATGGASLDYYPFPRHGFRLSPGVLFYNGNQITASATGSSGSDIKLNGTEYYTDSVNPMAVNAALGLNTHKQAFTITTGFGNMIPHKGGHFSFPFELGAAFIGTPSVNVGLTGMACANQSDASDNGASCVNMATNTTAQTNLSTQVSKWTSDLNALKAYPILSFGVAYAFRVR
jgi:hypothetical protein